MDITYIGHSCFRLRGKDASVVTDPFDPKMVGLKYSGLKADIVTVSHDHPDHNYTEGVKEVEKTIDGPGEYEIRGVSILGFQTYHDAEKGAERGKNTIYVYEFDDMRLVHLGDLGHMPAESIIEEIGSVDILFVPVGGEYTITSEEAVKVVQRIEPSIVIPMHYKVAGLNPETFSKLTPVEEFLKDIGIPVENANKLSIKKADFFESSNKVVVLEIG